MEEVEVEGGVETPFVHHSQEHSSVREGSSEREAQKETPRPMLSVALNLRHQDQNWISVSPRLQAREKLDHA